jgi:hypothetical protein
MHYIYIVDRYSDEREGAHKTRNSTDGEEIHRDGSMERVEIIRPRYYRLCEATVSCYKCFNCCCFSDDDCLPSLIHNNMHAYIFMCVN